WARSRSPARAPGRRRVARPARPKKRFGPLSNTWASRSSRPCPGPKKSPRIAGAVLRARCARLAPLSPLQVYGQPGLARRNVRPQRPLRDQVAARILFAKGNGLRRPEVVQAARQRLAHTLERGRVNAAGAIDDVRRQHIKPGVVQDAMLDGKQQVV